MKKLVFILLATLSLMEVQAQRRDPAYVQTISERTDKNLSGLGITDPGAAARVKEAIMNHYFTINDLGGRQDSLRKAGADARWVETYVDAELYRHHFAFISELMLDLNDEQIEGVKNALTYNVLNVTYQAQLDMIPTLTEAQKKRIYAWLAEARELAMDAGSSKAKHGIFGKYKGKINNYLSREGYDLTQERHAWQQRLENQRP